MAGITDKVLPHLESMEPWEILDSARATWSASTMWRGATTDWKKQPPADGFGRAISIAVLTNQVAIQVKTGPDSQE